MKLNLMSHDPTIVSVCINAAASPAFWLCCLAQDPINEATDSWYSPKASWNFSDPTTSQASTFTQVTMQLLAC
jgi:hypothetical protein